MKLNEPIHAPQEMNPTYALPPRSFLLFPIQTKISKLCSKYFIF